MRANDANRVQFIGQGPLPEFDYSRLPLPDKFRVLLWMLDGAERRHRLARRWQDRTTKEIQIGVQGRDIVVTVHDLSFTVIYHKPNDQPYLMAKVPPTGPIEFRVRAWKAANDKARELGWIV
jgi:hypothetical protein